MTSVPEEVTLDGPAASLRFKLDQNTSHISYECQVDIKSHMISPDDYENYKEVIDTLRDLADRYVICEVETNRVNGYSQASGS